MRFNIFRWLMRRPRKNSTNIDVTFKKANKDDIAIQRRSGGLEVMTMKELRAGLFLLTTISFILGIIVGIMICVYPISTEAICKFL